ncbi:terminase, partial [Cryobacterium zongtaii]
MATSSRSSAAAGKASQPKRFGSETPRIFTPPLRPLTRETSRGFECIEFAEEVLDIQLLPWQKWLLIHALELLEDGTFRFRYIVLLVARQNGKSTLMTVLSLWRMYVDGAPLIIGTAQNLDVAEEQWQTAVDIAEAIPELAAEIAESGGIVKVNGKKTLKLTSGERYKVQAASRRGGRGLSGDLVLLDELREHQAWDAWAAVTKTTIAKAFAQIWAASNAGDASSIVLRFLRKLAHLALGDPDGINETGITEDPAEIVIDDDEDDDAEPFVDDEDSLGIFEWSAPPGCAINDRNGWAQANPSLGYTIREKELASAARTDPEWVFRTECLCQWSEGTLEGPFPP